MRKSKKTKARDARDLSYYIGDRAELARHAFLSLKPSEVKAMAPKFAQKLPMDDIKALCLEELINMSTKSLRAILSCTSTPETVTLDTDSDDSSSEQSSETETSNTDTSDSEKTDHSMDSTEAAVEVMVVDDSDEDVKVNKPDTVNDVREKSTGQDKENEVVLVNSICNDGNSVDVTEQYVDRIKKLDKLSAKLGQEIEKLSKKKESSSHDLTNEYVNEMLSELTRIDTELSTEQVVKIRKESELINDSKNVVDLKESQKKAKIMVTTDERVLLTNRKQSKVTKHLNKRPRELSNQAKKRSEEMLAHSEPNNTAEIGETKENITRKPLVNTTVISNSTANRSADREKLHEVTSELQKITKDATVSLLSDSEHSQDELESELQESITESRKHKVLTKEKQRVKLKDVDRPHVTRTNVINRNKPFSEEDIEIEIVLDGGPNLCNVHKNVSTAGKSVNSITARKTFNVDEKNSKDSSETIVNNIIQQMDATNLQNRNEDSTDQITILSSGSDDSDKDPSGPEDGEVGSSDESECSEIKELNKKRNNKAGVLRITSKKVKVPRLLNGELCNDKSYVVDSSEENNSVAVKSIDIASVEKRNDHVKPQLKSAIVKVTDSDNLIEAYTNKVKSFAVKIPHPNENIKVSVGDANIKTRVLSNVINTGPKGKDGITVVVKNTENNSANENRFVKMTEDIKSLESVIVAVRNKRNCAEVAHLPSYVPEIRQSSNTNTKAYNILKPVEQRCIAKASDFVFVNPSDRGKPMLMAKTISSSENMTKPCNLAEMNETLLLHNEPDMDILEIDCSELTEGMLHVCDVTDNSNSYVDSIEQDTEQVNIVSKNSMISSNNVGYVPKVDDYSDTVNQSVEASIGTTRSLAKKDVLNELEAVNKVEPLNIANINDSAEIVSSKNKVVYAEDTGLENREPVECNLDFLTSSTETAKDVDSLNDSVKSIDNETENKEHVESASGVKHQYNINTDSVMDHIEHDMTEPMSLHLENKTTESNIDAVEKQASLDIAHTISSREAVVLDQGHRSLEEGKLEKTAEVGLPPANVGLKKCEIDAVTKLAVDALEDGEVTDPSSSDVESVEIPNEIICISDEEPGHESLAVESETGRHKKKKKKEKKKKDEKRRKKCTSKCKHKKQNKDTMVFTNPLDSCDKSNVEIISKYSNDTINEENKNTATEAKTDIFHIGTSNKHETKPIHASRTMIADSSDTEISKEAEGTADKTEQANTAKESSQNVIDMLSIEISSDDSSDDPIFEDLEDLTAAIDGIETQQMAEQIEREDEGDIENISWRDRYLDSKKVKKVLTTSSILNALRKKNKELKKKLQDSKSAEALEEVVPEPTVEDTTQKNVEEGSIEHYNTLQGSTKFVDPVPDPTDAKPTEAQTEETTTELTDAQTNVGEIDREKTVLETDAGNVQENVTKEMKKDAKNLLKMYKKLLKYNDVTRRSDPSKKKARKKKQKKDGTA